MNLKEFLIVEAPRRCGVHPAYGEIAKMILEEELIGNKAFAQENFKTIRERAKLAMPYNPANKKEYEKCLDVFEMILLVHYKSYHGEDTDEAISALNDTRTFTDVEQSVIISAESWWNA